MTLTPIEDDDRVLIVCPESWLDRCRNLMKYLREDDLSRRPHLPIVRRIWVEYVDQELFPQTFKLTVSDDRYYAWSHVTGHIKEPSESQDRFIAEQLMRALNRRRARGGEVDL